MHSIITNVHDYVMGKQLMLKVIVSFTNRRPFFFALLKMQELDAKKVARTRQAKKDRRKTRQVK